MDGMSGDWLVICVLGTALGISSLVEAELPDTVDPLGLKLGSLSNSSRVAKKSRSA